MAKETKITENNNSEITLEVLSMTNGYVELVITVHGNPHSIQLDSDDIDTLINELSYARGPRTRVFYSSEEIGNN